MKKYLALLLLLATPLWAADTLTTEDSSGIFRRTKATTIAIATNQIVSSNSVAPWAISGRLDPTQVGISGSTTYQPSDVNMSAGTWTSILTVTNNSTVGNLLVTGSAQYSDNNSAFGAVSIGARVLEVSLNIATTNIVASAMYDNAAAAISYGAPMPFSVVRTATTTNIYVLQGVVNGTGAGEAFRNASTSLTATTFSFTNATYLTLIKF
jgi:hypothetical protein